ncbi:MAG: hypothetical protein VKQ33_02880 [Candidatus Sericytochromatia bacterium]|nr:hypothetical protein [Candidatus Sericytochromatia bacterium]
MRGRAALIAVLGSLALPPAGLAEPAPTTGGGAKLAVTLRAALEGGEPARLRPLLPPTGPVTAWVAAQLRASATRGARRAAWHVRFAPLYQTALAQGGLLELEVAASGEAPASAVFPVELWPRGGGWVVGDPLPVAHPDARVVDQTLHLDLRSADLLRGELQLAVQLEGPDRRLFAALAPGMRLLGASAGGRALQAAQQGAWVYVRLPEGELRPVVSLRWEGAPPTLAGVPRQGALRAGARWFPQVAPPGAGPAPLTLLAMAPVGWAVVAPGRAGAVRRFEDGWLYRYSLEDASGDWPVWLGSWPQVAAIAREPRVEAWTREELAPEGARLAQEAWQAAADLGELVGGLPVPRLAFVEGTPAGARAGLVRVDGDLLRDDALRAWHAARAVAEAVVQRRPAVGRPGEVAWLEEALPTYLAALAAVRRQGAAGLRAPLLAAYRRYDAVAEGEADVPIAQARPGADEEAWRCLTEDKGMLVWHMLRRKLGDDAFARVLSECFGPAARGPLRIADVAKAGEGAVGSSLRPFFDQWLGRAGRPRLMLVGLAVARARTGWSVQGRLRQEGDSPYAMRVPIVMTTTGRPRVYEVDLQGEATRFVLHTPERPVGLRIDPMHDTLAASVAPPELPPAEDGAPAR